MRNQRFSGIGIQLVIALMISQVIAACQAAPPPAAVPSPQFWRVQYTPALAWMAPAFNLCIRQQPGYALLVYEKPDPALDLALAEITLRLGAAVGDSGYQVELGSDELVVVVNPQNPLQELTGSQVRNIFSGSSRAWSKFSKGNANPIQVWVYPHGEEIRQYFESALSPTSLYPAAHLAPDPAAVQQAVAADPAAIGYLPARWVDSSVRRLSIPDISAHSLHLPILAITQTKPQGAQKEWLLCLQHSIAQK